MIILGYAGYNSLLREEGILINRTCREKTAKDKGIDYLINLFHKNLLDLVKTIQWNIKNDIKFYRISSDIAPHCTNKTFIKDKDDITKLAYDIKIYKNIFEKIGKLAKDNNLRLTFHPDVFNVLNSPDPNVINNTYRTLYMHAYMLDLMKLDYNSVIILHGGGVYGDKKMAIKRFINNFMLLPKNVKKRIVIENDETNYSINDVLYISKKINVPVVFDIFHYYCYNYYIIKRNSDEVQLTLDDLLPKVKETWKDRLMKVHLSEQKKDSIVGTHSDFIKKIPDELLTFAKKINPDNLYIMCECKMKELCLNKLRDKYKNNKIVDVI